VDSSKKPYLIGSPMAQTHIRSAILLAEQAAIIENSNKAEINPFLHAYDSFVISAVISSACYLECTINEWLQDYPARRTKGKSALIRNLWNRGIPRTARYPILEKYQIALTILGRETFPEGKAPFQDAAIVIELRNLLVHHEMTWQSVGLLTNETIEHKIAKKLRYKFRLNPGSPESSPFWPYRCLSAGCALWAVDSAIELVDDFIMMVDRGYPFHIRKKEIAQIRKQASKYKLQHITKDS
jgi:hypothetical protein